MNQSVLPFPISTYHFFTAEGNTHFINNAFQILQAVELTHLPHTPRQSRGYIKGKENRESDHSQHTGMNKIMHQLHNKQAQIWNNINTKSIYTPLHQGAGYFFKVNAESANKSYLYGEPG
jgi:hypothetical protein